MAVSGLLSVSCEQAAGTLPPLQHAISQIYSKRRRRIPAELLLGRKYDVSTVATKLNMTDDWVSMGSSLFVQDKASPALPHTMPARKHTH